MATQINTPVIIVGAGPSGLAASACLTLRGVPSIVLDRDDCVGLLWRKRAYDRLHLHLPKQHSALPHAPHDDAAPTYLPRGDFIRYLDGYAERFAVRARLRREVRAARFDPDRGRWEVDAVNLDIGEEERYSARYLVVATGEFSEKVVPEVPGLEGFPGKSLSMALLLHGCCLAPVNAAVLPAGRLLPCRRPSRLVAVASAAASSPSGDGVTAAVDAVLRGSDGSKAKASGYGGPNGAISHTARSTIERVIFDFRFLALLAIAGSLAGSLLCFLNRHTNSIGRAASEVFTEDRWSSGSSRLLMCILLEPSC